LLARALSRCYRHGRAALETQRRFFWCVIAKMEPEGPDKTTDTVLPEGPANPSVRKDSIPVKRKVKKGKKKVKKGRFSDHLEPPRLLELKTIYEGPGGKSTARMLHSTMVIVTNRTVEIEREGANACLTALTLGCWYFFFQTASIEIYEVS
jgi:hypothetical protein